MNGRNQRTLADITRELEEIARVGQAFVDGDLMRRALQPYAETFLKGDDLDFNPETSVPLKKTLFKLERLSRAPCSTVLWRERPDMRGRMEALLYGSFAPPIQHKKIPGHGYQPPRFTPEIARIFRGAEIARRITKSGNRETRILIDRGFFRPIMAPEGASLVECFVPVKDSMGEIAGVLEVFAVVTGKTRPIRRKRKPGGKRQPARRS